MSIIKGTSLMVALIFFCSTAYAATSNTVMREQMLLPVVAVTVIPKEGKPAFGSGFLIENWKYPKRDCVRYVLTNFHVVKSIVDRKKGITGAIMINIPTYEKGAAERHELLQAVVVALNPVEDIAILSLFEPQCNGELHTVNLQHNQKLSVFDEIWVVSALGGDVEAITVSKAVISRLSRSDSGIEYFGVSVPVLAGQSGGAVYVKEKNSGSYLLGAMLKGSTQEDPLYNNAIPATVIRSFLEKVDEQVWDLPQ